MMHADRLAPAPVLLHVDLGVMVNRPIRITVLASLEIRTLLGAAAALIALHALVAPLRALLIAIVTVLAARGISVPFSFLCHTCSALSLS